MPRTIRPDLDGSRRRIAIVAARFTEEISGLMLERAVATLTASGVPDEAITVAWVAGSFELPLVCDTLAGTGDYDGIIALGCVIRGETTHYDYVCDGATRGILDTSLSHGIPVLFGVLTTENRAQAMARANGDKCDKGAECAAAVLELIGTLEAIRSGHAD